MSYYNQREHPHFDRNLVIPWLSGAQTMELSPIDTETDDEHFEQLWEACESSLERNVLEAVRDDGFPLPDVAQKTIYTGDEPVAQADFFYEATERPQPIVVFVDGPDHKKEHVERDDSAKRERLLGLGYRVVSVSDPADVPELWDRI